MAKHENDYKNVTFYFLNGFLLFADEEKYELVFCQIQTISCKIIFAWYETVKLDNQLEKYGNRQQKKKKKSSY